MQFVQVLQYEGNVHIDMNVNFHCNYKDEHVVSVKLFTIDSLLSSL